MVRTEKELNDKALNRMFYCLLGCVSIMIILVIIGIIIKLGG